MDAPAERRGPSTNHRTGRRRPAFVRRAIVWVCVGLAGAGTAGAADLEEVENLFRTGRYEECARQAAEEIAGGALGERWDALRIQSELAQG